MPLGSQVILGCNDIIVPIPTVVGVWTPPELLRRCTVRLDDVDVKRFTESLDSTNKVLDARRTEIISMKVHAKDTIHQLGLDAIHTLAKARVLQSSEVLRLVSEKSP